MLIAFEGIDGSGKATQARMLHERLTQDLDEALRAEPRQECDFLGASLLSFPNYDRSVFGPHVRRYLRGDFGPLDANDPFLVSLLYAIDRYESHDSIEHLMRGCQQLLICDRYVPSNIAHQGAKAWPNWRPLARHIEATEYGVFRMPEPNLVFLLDLSADQSYIRTHERDDEADLHQDSIDYMAKVREVYLELERVDTRWHLIKCMDDDGRERNIDEIHDEIWEIVSQAREETFNRSPYTP